MVESRLAMNGHSHNEKPKSKSAADAAGWRKLRTTVLVSILTLACGVIVGGVIARQLDFDLLVQGVPELARRDSGTTRVYADDGKTIIAEWVPRHSISITLKDMPPVVAGALRLQTAGQLPRRLSDVLVTSAPESFKTRLNDRLLAFELGWFYSEEELLEIYANRCPVGGNASGLEVGALIHFGKPLEELTTGDVAFLLALVDSHGVVPSDVEVRRWRVLDRMKQAGLITPSDVEIAKSLPPALINTPPTLDAPLGKSPVFDHPLAEVKKALDGLFDARALAIGDIDVYTSINAEAQKLAHEALQAKMRATLTGTQGALITLNARNGEVIALAGSNDYREDPVVHATETYRQTGSTFMPVIYSAATEWGMQPDSVVRGDAIMRGEWQPHNQDGSTSHANVQMKTALARAYNVATVHLLDLVGIQTGAQMSRRFGLTEPMDPSLLAALGTTEAPLIEMVSAYSAFPNDGVRHAWHLIRRVTDRRGKTVMSEPAAASYPVISNYIALTLVGMMREAAEQGEYSPAKSLGVPLGGMTGTVEQGTDAWFIGFTPTYVTGVWIGSFDNNNPSNKLKGETVALPLFVDYMKGFLRGKPVEDFPAPPEMPEEMKKLHEQRRRELEEERQMGFSDR